MSTSFSLRVLRKIIGSAVAVLAGTVTGIIAMLLLGWDDWHACLFMIGIFALPAWLLVVLPLHVLLPGSSRFWRPTISAGIGAASGAMLLTVYFAFSGDAPFVLIVLFLPIALIVGVVTGLVGSALARCYYETGTA